MRLLFQRNYYYFSTMDFSLIVEADGIKAENIENMIKRSFELGYECIALNTVISSSTLQGKNINIPNPITVNFEGKFGRRFRILNRLTAVVEDPIHAHNMLRNPVTKKYDLVALQPVGEKILRHVTEQVDVDIICLNLSEDLGYTLKKTHVGPAIHKGMTFEISYSPCLRSQVCKRSIISKSQHLVDVCKGKNIIISSGALRPLELRSPEDVINLSLLFNFRKDQAVEAVRKNGHTVMAHAGTRKETGCGFVSITGCMKLPKQQGWIVKMCKVPPLPTKQSSETGKRKFRNSDDETSNAKKGKLESVKTETNKNRSVKSDDENDTSNAKKCKIEDAD